MSGECDGRQNERIGRCLREPVATRQHANQAYRTHCCCWYGIFVCGAVQSTLVVLLLHTVRVHHRPDFSPFAHTDCVRLDFQHGLQLVDSQSQVLIRLHLVVDLLQSVRKRGGRRWYWRSGWHIHPTTPTPTPTRALARHRPHPARTTVRAASTHLLKRVDVRLLLRSAFLSRFLVPAKRNGQEISKTVSFHP